MATIKNKTLSSSSPKFVSGGKHKMFGKTGVAAQQPGVSATTRGNSKLGGGSTKMFGKSGVKPAKPL
jgi:hypothetical protein